MPFPSAFNDGLDCLKARRPAEFAMYFFRRSDEACGIPGAAGLFYHANFPPSYGSARCNDFAYACPPPSSKIVLG